MVKAKVDEVEEVSDGTIYKFRSTNKFLYINFESIGVEVQFIDGLYETDNKAVADSMANVVDVSALQG